MIEMAQLSSITTMETGFQFGWIPSTHQAQIEHVRKTSFCKKEYIIKVANELAIQCQERKKIEYPKELRQKEINI